MALLLMVTLVGVMLGGLMIPIVVNQDHATTFDGSRVEALDAAQAGIDVVLGQIRSSVTSDGTGDDAQLPCGPFNGNAVSNGVASYHTEVIYYTEDPIANASASTLKAMICAPGYGPYDGTSTRSPSYACIISSGVAGGSVPTTTTNTNTTCATAVGMKGSGAGAVTTGRTIVTTYVFNTEDNNVAGGEIRIFPDGSGNQFCMDAGSATPAAKTTITMQPCSTSTPPAAQQTFAYRTDLSIQLVSSITATTPLGLCLDSATPHANGNTIYLDTCSADPNQSLCSTNPTKATYACTSTTDQQWSIDDNSHLEGAKSDASDIDGYCINVAYRSSGLTGLVPTLQTCAGGTTDTSQTWVPSPSAGAGQAGATNGQEVNYFLFANCLDVTGQDPTSSFLILYTCKQNPNPRKVTWNQIFTPNPTLATDATERPVNVELVTNDTANSTRYCLTSPLRVGSYVTVQSGSSNCPSSVPSSGGAVWTVYRVLDSSGNELPYDSRYVIEDSKGECLGLGGNSDLYTGVYEKVIVTTCDGSTSQKWNANPSTTKSSLQDTIEVTTGS